MHEGQRDELGESPGALLDAPQHAQMRHPVRRVVDVAVHHRRARAQAHLVRGRHDVDPCRGRQLALGEDPAHIVVEDLGRGARDRVKPRLAGRQQPFPRRQTGARRSVGDLHGAEGVQVDAGGRRLHGAGEVEVRRSGQVRVDAALHADLGGTCRRGLADPGTDLVEREGVGIDVLGALRERTEAAAGVADIGEVDIAVDDVGHVVTHHLAAKVIGQGDDGVERGTVTRHESDGRVVLLWPGQGGGIAMREVERGAQVGRQSGWRAHRRHALAHLGPVAVDVFEVRTSVGPASLGVDGGVQVGPPARLAASERGVGILVVIGLLPRQAERTHAGIHEPVRAGQRIDVGAQARIDPGLGGDVGRMRGEPRAQDEAGRRRAITQVIEMGPRPLGIHVVGRQWTDAAPVVDASAKDRREVIVVGQVGRGLQAHARAEDHAGRR